MLHKKLLIISFFTILLIGVFHYLSMQYSWYWIYKWIDVPIHFLGGFWFSLTSLWISLKVKHIDNILGYKKKALFVMLISVLIIAVFWELFELIFNITSIHSIGYWQDSLSDILNGFLGGMIAFLYFTKNKKAECSITENSPTHNFIVVL